MAKKPAKPSTKTATSSAPLQNKAANSNTILSIELDEQTQVLSIRTPKGNTIQLSDKENFIVLRDLNGNTVEMNAQGISLTSTKDVNIKAGRDINFVANQNIHAKAAADVKLEGMRISANAQQAFSANGSTAASITSNGQTTVKGGIVLIN